MESFFNLNKGSASLTQVFLYREGQRIVMAMTSRLHFINHIGRQSPLLGRLHPGTPELWAWHQCPLLLLPLFQWLFPLQNKEIKDGARLHPKGQALGRHGPEGIETLEALPASEGCHLGCCPCPSPGPVRSRSISAGGM